MCPRCSSRRFGHPKTKSPQQHAALKPPVSDSRAHQNPITGEAHDIRVAVVGYVRKQARVEVLAAPAPGASTKGGELKHRRRRTEQSVSGIQHARWTQSVTR